MSFRILGTGMYVPSKIVTNGELAELVDTSDDWIRQRVGVCSRHICETETAADLAYEASVRALEKSGVRAEELDLILVASVSSETVSPSIGCLLQSRLGADCIAFDLNAACASFLFLMETAAGFFARGARRALIVGAERMSRIVDWEDRATCVIFGDGAGAAVLGEGNGYRSSTFTVRGGDKVIRIPQFTGKSPFYKGPVEHPYIYMNGQETFKYAVNAICSDLETVMSREGLQPGDIRFVVPHQANYRIMETAARRLGLPLEKFYINIDRYGNTSSASIPIALDELSRQGKLRRGDMLLMEAFGGGLANAACALEW